MHAPQTLPGERSGPYAPEHLLLTDVNGDYIMTISLATLSNPNHTLASGDCCEPPPLNQIVCPASCNTTLKVCIRGPNHNQTESACPQEELIVAGKNGGSWKTVYPGDWTGSVQLYIIIIHDLTETLGSQSPGNPVVGELIDFVFVDNITLSTNEAQPLTDTYTGRFQQATLELSLSVTCTFEFYGSLCDVFCPLARNDSLMHVTCDETGSMVCLEGYRGLETNCTDCVPMNGCSEEGGFCVNPGECVCRDGFSGLSCSNVSASPSPSPTQSTITPSPSTPGVVPVHPPPLTSTNPVTIALGVILGIILFLVFTSLTVFIITLVIVYCRKQEMKNIKGRQRSHDIVHTISTPEPDFPLNTPSYSAADTAAPDPIYSTIGESNRTWPQETFDVAHYSQPTVGVAHYSQPTVGVAHHSQPTVGVAHHSKPTVGMAHHNQATLVEGNEEMSTLPQLSNLTFRDHRTLTSSKEDLSFGDVFSLGEDLLAAIDYSLSQSTEHKHSVAATETTPGAHVECLELGADRVPSFIYSDLFDDGDQELVFRTPSISPNSTTRTRLADRERD